jgi:phage host-nuclease inhibitor protein Gam
MNDEKQASIKIVKDCDDMFEKMLKDIGQELDATQELYAPQVKILQENIRRVMSLDTKIRVAEQENNTLLDARRAAEIPQTQTSGIKPKVNMPTDSTKVLNAYKQGKTNYKG